MLTVTDISVGQYSHLLDSSPAVVMVLYRLLCVPLVFHTTLYVRGFPRDWFGTHLYDFFMVTCTDHICLPNLTISHETDRAKKKDGGPTTWYGIVCTFPSTSGEDEQCKVTTVIVVIDYVSDEVLYPGMFSTRCRCGDHPLRL